MTIPVFTLSNGIEIPQVGLGTYGLKGSEGVTSLVQAMESGYRYLDTAYNYENEATVGKAVQQSGLNREDLFIASKLPGRYHGRKDALIAIEEGLFRSGLDYFDIYLIHWPNPKQDQYVEAWKALVEARERGLIKHLGTSNFLPEHIDRIVKETGVSPLLNQVELHPYFQQNIQREYHQKHNILTQSWSPLGRLMTKFEQPVTDLPVIQQLAEKHGRTSAQIILRWHLQLGAMPIPKSGDVDRQRENLDVFDFELTADDLRTISQYDRPDGRNKDQDPSVYEEF